VRRALLVFAAAVPPAILLGWALLQIGWSEVAAGLYAGAAAGAIAWPFARRIQTRAQEKR
jgi:hypothetical protein